MNRRDFLSSLIAVPLAAWLAPKVVDWKTIPGDLYLDGSPVYGMYGSIERSTYQFWRNQGLGQTHPLTPETIMAMTDAYNECAPMTMQ